MFSCFFVSLSLDLKPYFRHFSEVLSQCIFCMLVSEHCLPFTCELSEVLWTCLVWDGLLFLMSPFQWASSFVLNKCSYELQRPCCLCMPPEFLLCAHVIATNRQKVCDPSVANVWMVSPQQKDKIHKSEQCHEREISEVNRAQKAQYLKHPTWGHSGN